MFLYSQFAIGILNIQQSIFDIELPTRHKIKLYHGEVLIEAYLKQ